MRPRRRLGVAAALVGLVAAGRVGAAHPGARPPAAPCRGAAVALTDDERRTLDLHNARRAADGLPAFCLDAQLTAAARAHSAEMLAHDYLGHESFGGESFGARIARFGYGPWRRLAENVAFGSGALGDPATTFAGWMGSVGHRRNIQNGGLREIGIGVRVGRFQGVAGTRVYTVDFGTR